MKKNSPLKLLHLALMVILMFGSSFSTVMFFTRNEAAVAGKGEMEVILNGCSTLVVVLMLITGILYLVHGYKKNAAVYYLAFILLLVLVNVLVVLIDVLYTQMTPLIIIKCILYSAKIIVLLIMAFGKNLGKKMTWTLLYVVVALDIAGMIVMLIYMFQNGFDFALIGVVAAIVADVTMGLAIRGKYQDKESRGSN
ncbi:MAG: hypothetical protein IKZ65_00205 [Lachnospiraceae bacterium]|nr:hypothetical protein [Lachnospiraceae bacterium]